MTPTRSKPQGQLPAKAAGSEDRQRLPAHWDKRVSAAYLRLLGHTQKEAARAVGRAARTLRGWEKEESWPVAQAEARERWLDGLADQARRTLSATLRVGEARGDPGDGSLALKTLERLEERLSPPLQRHAGPDGGPIQVAVIAPPRPEER